MCFFLLMPNFPCVFPRYQVRCLLEQPIFVKAGQVVTGRVLMAANMKQSYDVTIECQIMGTNTKSQNSLDLKNPYFRYTGVQPAPPPGENNESPSENYWAQMDMQGARQVSTPSLLYLFFTVGVNILARRTRKKKKLILQVFFSV